MQLPKKNILGVGVTDADSQTILKFILQAIGSGRVHQYVVTPNPEMLVASRKNLDFKRVLNNAEIALSDGVGLLWAARILGKPLYHRVTGVDFVKNLCEKSNEKPITVGFLGGRGKIAERTAECLRKEYPAMRVVLAEAGNPDDETAQMVSERVGKYFAQHNRSTINHDRSTHNQVITMGKNTHDASHPELVSGSNQAQKMPKQVRHDNSSMLDVLFVAYGHPKQELWMAKHLDQLPVRVMIGVGGAFDYLSGSVPRAPKILRNVGLEWVFRLLIQPWRWKRQLALIEFIYLVFKERFFQSS